ncbi:PriCT-2 domain-containing protein [Paraburkholderia phosphatilytica]|uniref:PriCT-2 domain-containing protein n=1 Tax=Paraburkholderia phosphatilytica TaxID=2282883 RepID=UPI000E4DAA37|nr:PriCT-2 domain-containing protein [Paraburkholderia phosphatilytica]
MSTRHVSEADRVRAALAVIPAEDYTTWIGMAFAVKAGLGEDGFGIWDAWSRTAHNYSERAARAAWRSAGADGRKTLASLFWLARQHGFDPGYNGVQGDPRGARPGDRQGGQTASLAHRPEAAARDDARLRARHAAVAREACAIWQCARPVGPAHPYLERKQVAPVPALRELEAQALRVLLGYPPCSSGEPLEGRVLVVPVHAGDTLSTLELIDADGRKSALAGGLKAGGCWIATAGQTHEARLLPIVIAEGVATALSAWQATGWMCVAALSAGNLARVAAAWRARYPQAELLVLAESGAGHEAALRAAQAVSAALAMPRFAPQARIAGAVPTDFNDMAVLSGLRAVGDLLRDAVYAEQKQPPGAAAGPGRQYAAAMTADRPMEGRAMERDNTQQTGNAAPAGQRRTLRLRAGQQQASGGEESGQRGEPDQAPGQDGSATAHTADDVRPHGDAHDVHDVHGQALTAQDGPVRREAGELLYGLDTVPPETRALAQHRFGVQVRMATPRVNGGPYRGEVYSTEHYVIQEVSTRSVVFHAKAGMEFISGRLRWMDENQRLNGADVQVAYDGVQPKVYPWDRARDQLERTVASLKKSARDMGLGPDLETTLEQLQTASWIRVREARAAAFARTHGQVRDGSQDVPER